MLITQYRIGGTVICTSSGCTPAAGSNNYIQNQNSGAQSANFDISGTATIGTSELIKTSTNNTSAFQVQNSSGYNELNVDTT